MRFQQTKEVSPTRIMMPACCRDFWYVQAVISINESLFSADGLPSNASVPEVCLLGKYSSSFGVSLQMEADRVYNGRENVGEALTWNATPHGVNPISP